MSNYRLLAIYLNDHLAGATLGRALARRAARSNRGTPLGAFLEQLVREIEEDKSSLEDVLPRLGVKRSAVKPALALVAERMGRLKLNGRLVRYSPLSRLLELEGLVIGVTGKRALWRSLRELGEPRLAGVDLDELERRAEAQIAELERHRVEAARRALGSS